MKVAALKKLKASVNAPRIVLTRRGKPDSGAPALTLLPGGKASGPVRPSATPVHPPLVSPPALRLPPPLAPAPPRAVVAFLCALALHAVVLAGLFAASHLAGSPDPAAETSIAVEFAIEPAITEPAIAPVAETAPEIAIAIELPPPLPDPVVEAPEPAQAALAPPPEIAVDLPEPLAAPVFNFEPPVLAPAIAPAPVIARRPPPVRQIEAERQRREELARRHERQAAATRASLARAALEKTRLPARKQAQTVVPRAQAQPPRAAPAGRGDNTMSMSAFRAAVAAKIARNKPATSTAASAQGLVVIAFSISASGAATAIRVSRSSGVGTLDAAELSAVRRASPFPPPPPGAMRSFAVPMQFNQR